MRSWIYLRFEEKAERDRGLCFTCEHMQINISWLESFLSGCGGGEILEFVSCVSAHLPLILHGAGVAPPLLLPPALPWTGTLVGHTAHPGYTAEMVCFWLSTIQQRNMSFLVPLAFRVLSVSRSFTIKNLPSPCHHNCTSAG